MRLVRVICVVVAAALAGTLAPRAQDASRLQQWLDAVRTHTPGEWDAAARLAGSWSSDDLREVLDALRDKPRDAGTNRVLLAGAMLHADVAILGLDRQRKSAPGDRLVSYARDGRHYGQHVIEPGWAFSRRLLDAVTPDGTSEQTAALWYRATTAHMAQYGQLAEADPHLERARRLFPDNAHVLFDSGWLFEDFASPQTLASISDMTQPGTRISRPDVPSPGDAREQAEEYYNRALAINPAFAKARVHRGRVRTLRRNLTGAIQDFHAVLDAPAAPTFKYYAALFLGGAHEAMDETELAHRAYERAAAIFPLAQSPHLALSRLATRRGDMPAAHREIQRVLGLSQNRIDRGDPWWLYWAGSGREVETLLAELRAAIKAGAGS